MRFVIESREFGVKRRQISNLVINDKFTEAQLSPQSLLLHALSASAAKLSLCPRRAESVGCCNRHKIKRGGAEEVHLLLAAQRRSITFSRLRGARRLLRTGRLA